MYGRAATTRATSRYNQLPPVTDAGAGRQQEEKEGVQGIAKPDAARRCAYPAGSARVVESDKEREAVDCRYPDAAVRAAGNGTCHLWSVRRRATSWNVSSQIEMGGGLARVGTVSTTNTYCVIE